MSFIAQYLSDCANCSELITPGQKARFDPSNEVVHVHCPEAAVDTSAGPACERCWLIHRGECL